MNLNHLIAAVMNAAASRLSPIAPKHPLPQFYGQHTNPRRNGRRQQNKALGSRQARKLRKQMNASAAAGELIEVEA